MEQDEIMSEELVEEEEEEEFLDAEEGGVTADSAPLHVQLPPSQQMASALGLDTHRMQVMKASFFAEEGREEVSLFRKPPAALREPMVRRPGVGVGAGYGLPQTRQARVLSGPQQSLHTTLLSHLDDSFPSRQLTRGTTPSNFLGSSSTVASPLPPTTTYTVTRELQAQAQSSLLAPRLNLSQLVTPVRAVVSGRSRSLADAGLFLGRSFRVGWGPNWTLAHWGVQLAPSSTPVTGSINPLPTGGSAHVNSNLAEEGLKFRVVVEKVHAVPWWKEGEERTTQGKDRKVWPHDVCVCVYTCRSSIIIQV